MKRREKKGRGNVAGEMGKKEDGYVCGRKAVWRVKKENEVGKAMGCGECRCSLTPLAGGDSGEALGRPSEALGGTRAGWWQREDGGCYGL